MNDEIKEIERQLKYLENWLIQHQRYKIMGDLDSIFSFNLDDLQKFYDYITNLQEENKHLDEVNCQLRKKINNDIYKSRCKKAIEYIEEKGRLKYKPDELINILEGKK